MRNVYAHYGNCFRNCFRLDVEMHVLTGISLLAAALPAVVFAATPLYISTPSGVTTGVPTDLIYTAPNMTQVFASLVA